MKYIHTGRKKSASKLQNSIETETFSRPDVVVFRASRRHVNYAASFLHSWSMNKRMKWIQLSLN